VRERLIRHDIADSDVKMLTRRLTPGLAGYVLMIVLGLFLPVAAVLWLPAHRGVHHPALRRSAAAGGGGLTAMSAIRPLSRLTSRERE
jgi:hypothetical protein